MATFAEVLEHDTTAETPAAGVLDLSGVVFFFDSGRPRTIEAPACLRMLSLDLSCTLDDVKRSFRKLALETHPDRPGGSHAAFMRARDAFEQAVRFVANDVPRAPHVSRAAPESSAAYRPAYAACG